MRRWALGGFLAVAASCGGTAAAQESLQAVLEWRVPAACGDEAHAAGAVEALLERSAFVRPGGAAELVLAVQGSESGGEWSFHLALRAANGAALGEREVRQRAASCDAVMRSLAVVIALMIDLPRAEVLAAAPPQRPPAPAVPVQARRLRLPAADRAPVTLSADAGSRFSLGWLPDLAVGLTGGAAITIPPLWPIRVDLTLWLPDETYEDGVGARFWAWHVGLSTCPRLLRARVDVAICAGAMVGQISGQGLGLEMPDSALKLDVALRAVAVARARLTSLLAVVVGLGATMELTRYEYFVEVAGEQRELHRGWLVAPEASIALELAVPDSAESW